MPLSEYFEIGIFFACLSVLSNMITARYFVPKMNEEILQHAGMKSNNKTKESFFQIIQLFNVNNNLSLYGLMFTWVICWPAMLIFTAIKIIVWLIKVLSTTMDKL